MLSTDAAARLALASILPIWKERDMQKKKKNSLLYILDSSLPRKQPWPGITGQPPPINGGNKQQKKDVLERNESTVTGPLIKRRLASECGGLHYFGRHQLPLFRINTPESV